MSDNHDCDCVMPPVGGKTYPKGSDSLELSNSA